MNSKKLSPRPSQLPDVGISNASLDIRGGKNISVFILQKVTDAFEGIRNDMKAWGRLSGNEVQVIETDGNYHRYLIQKKKKSEKEPKKKFAIIVSNDELTYLLSPLGFALAACIAGMEVSLYFQGPGVRALRKDFKGNLKGWQRPFSPFARRGLADSGHVLATEKIGLLHKMGAKIFVCHPSLRVFGVKTSDMAFPEDIILAEYVTFLEEMQNASVKLYP